MPRQMRIDFPGAIHHVMSRGDRRENIYLDDVDRQDFLKTLAEACQKTDWQDEEQLKPLRRGWCLGSPEFRERMLEQLEQRAGENPNAEVRRESAAAKAERIVAQELARLGWKEEELVRQRKNAPEKLAIAARLRKETILPLKSRAARVGLGTSKGANRNLHAWMQQTEKQDIRRKEDTVCQQMNRSMA